MVVLLWLESRLSGESRSSGTSATDRPEGERDADERGQGDGGKIARDDRGRAEADGDLPEVEQGVGDQPQRSEEHTSELQSLMRISYAVFCLQKKTYKPC